MLISKLYTKIKKWLCVFKKNSTLEIRDLKYDGRHIQSFSYVYPYKYSITDDFLTEENYKKVVNYYKKLKEDYDNNFSYAKLYNVNTANVPYEIFPFLYDENIYNIVKEISEKKDILRMVAVTMHHNRKTEEDKYIHSDYSDILSRIDYVSSTFLRNIWLDKKYKVSHFLKDNKENSYDKNEYEELKRYVTAIYYFDNDLDNIGGETGIFAKEGNDFIEVDAVACKNNRLLIFENNEYSFHNYKKCSLENRNCIIFWFHKK